MKNLSGWWRPLFAIARVTFQEIVLDKVLYNFLLFAFVLISVSYLAAQLTFIGQDRVILDFGMSAINLSCGVIGVFTGASMLAREFDRRTIFVALARPITRLQFVLGKYTGLCAVLLLNWLLLSAIAALLFVSLGGKIVPTTLYAFFFLWLQSCFLAAFGIFLSSFTTTSISIMGVIGLYMIGNNVEPLRQILEKSKEVWVQTFILPLVDLIPNLGHFNLGFTVTYGLEVDAQFALKSLAYAVVWIAPLLLLTGTLLNRREG